MCRVKWTDIEIQWLKRGMDKYADEKYSGVKGQRWKRILHDPDFDFDMTTRNSVSLKDKWRQLCAKDNTLNAPPRARKKARKWTPAEVKEMEKAMRKYGGKEYDNIKGARFETIVNDDKIDLKFRNKAAIRDKWRQLQRAKNKKKAPKKKKSTRPKKSKNSYIQFFSNNFSSMKAKYKDESVTDITKRISKMYSKLSAAQLRKLKRAADVVYQKSRSFAHRHTV